MTMPDSVKVTRWQEIGQLWTENRWLYGVVGFLLGMMALPALEELSRNVDDLMSSLVPEAVGIIFTVLILDRLAENRSHEALKERLFNEMRSSAVGQGTAALAWLRREGWVNMDTLQGMDLHRANWENAYIGELNLERANLNGATLKNVTNQITDEQGITTESPVMLKQAALRYAQLDEAVLIGADLTEASMKKAHLQNVILIRATLVNADLTQADLQNADLRMANLVGANLLHTRLDGVKWADSDGQNAAILPDGERWSPAIDMRKFTDPDHAHFVDVTSAQA